MPTAPSCPTPQLYPTPRTPSSVARDVLWEITPQGATHPLCLTGNQSTKVICLAARSFFFVNPRSSLDDRALCQQLGVVLNHNYIIHKGHYPPWLGIFFGRSLQGCYATECEKYFFMTEYKYRILFGFQKSSNTEFFSRVRKSKYQIQIIVFGLTIRILMSNTE